jgi:glycosyltransferase involved in cell wall biosynthesis
VTTTPRSSSCPCGCGPTPSPWPTATSCWSTASRPGSSDALGRLPHDRVTLHLAGRDDVEPAYTERVRGRLAVLGDRVVHHGVLDRDGIARLYAGADVFVLPSWREPYGTVYGEALAAGLPVVGWRAGNLPHLVSDGVEGVVLDPGDVPALAAALDRLASDELWRAAVARAAGRRGAALPRWSHTAATLFAALKELTASAR